MRAVVCGMLLTFRNQQAVIRSLPDAMDAPLPELNPHPGPRWNLWDIVVSHIANAAGIGLLNLRLGKF